MRTPEEIYDKVAKEMGRAYGDCGRDSLALKICKAYLEEWKKGNPATPIEQLCHSLEVNIDPDGDQDSCSWNYQEGVLISYNEARLISNLLKRLI